MAPAGRQPRTSGVAPRLPTFCSFRPVHVSQGLPQCLPPSHWGSPVTRGGPMDYVATRTGDTLTVHYDYWTITYTEGTRLVDITDPEGHLTDDAQIVEWGFCGRWILALHGGSPATVESLLAALFEYIDSRYETVGLHVLED